MLRHPRLDLLLTEIRRTVIRNDDLTGTPLLANHGCKRNKEPLIIRMIGKDTDRNIIQLR